MHRKFIALVTSVAIAAPAFAAPARADDDTARTLFGLGALALLGAAVIHSRNDADTVTRYSEYPAPVSRPLPPAPPVYPAPVSRPLPPVHPAPQPNWHHQDVDRRWQPAGRFSNVPRECRVRVTQGHYVTRTFDAACLRQKGYYVSRR